MGIVRVVEVDGVKMVEMECVRKCVGGRCTEVNTYSYNICVVCAHRRTGVGALTSNCVHTHMFKYHSYQILPAHNIYKQTPSQTCDPNTVAIFRKRQLSRICKSAIVLNSF